METNNEKNRFNIWKWGHDSDILTSPNNQKNYDDWKKRKFGSTDEDSITFWKWWVKFDEDAKNVKLSNFFKDFVCDLRPDSEYCQAAAKPTDDTLTTKTNQTQTTNNTQTSTSEDFPPCAIKLGKVIKTPSGADVIVYKTTIWDKPNVQLYSKINRFVVLGGSEKGKMGNYKCTESGKLFLELDSEKKVDPKKDGDKKQGSGLTSTNLTSDDILNGKGSVKIGMKGNVVGEIQNLLILKGFKEVSKTGNADNTFGPLTDKMVREFQTKNGLTVDGIVGPNTWSKLKESTTQDTSGMGDDSPEFLQAQQDNRDLKENFIKKIVSKNLKSLIK